MDPIDGASNRATKMDKDERGLDTDLCGGWSNRSTFWSTPRSPFSELESDATLIWNASPDHTTMAHLPTGLPLKMFLTGTSSASFFHRAVFRASSTPRTSPSPTVYVSYPPLLFFFLNPPKLVPQPCGPPPRTCIPPFLSCRPCLRFTEPQFPLTPF